MTNYYDILEVGKDASQEDIKAAFRRLSKQHHPDVNGGDKQSEERFKTINEAYSTLSDPQKKQQYDMGQQGRPNPFGHANPFGGNPFGGNPFADAGFSSFFNDMFGNQFGGGQPSMPDEQIKMRPVVIPVNITFEDSYFGAQKTLKINNCKIKCEVCDASGRVDKQHKMCGKCGGKGKIVVSSQQGQFFTSSIANCDICKGLGIDLQGSEACFSCKGEGSVVGKKEVPISIPPGLMQGEAFGMKGDGHFMRNGESGDLVIKINEVINNTKYKRMNQDLILYIDIPIEDAICDDEISIPHLDGTPRKYKVKSLGHAPIMFENQGFRSPHKPPGDFVVFTTTKLPDNMEEEDMGKLREILEKYK